MLYADIAFIKLGKWVTVKRAGDFERNGHSLGPIDIIE
jgi:hypothetical protein